MKAILGKDIFTTEKHRENIESKFKNDRYERFICNSLWILVLILNVIFSMNSVPSVVNIWR